MAALRAFPLLVATTLMLSGCSTDPARVVDEPAPIAALSDLGVGPLWNNPATFPHPAYGFPTLTHPQSDPVNPWLRPIPAESLPPGFNKIERVGRAETSFGHGMALIGRIAVLPSNPTKIIDISDPRAPRVVSEYAKNTRGSDIIAYPDGRIVAVLATGFAPLLVLDVTDPTRPVELAVLQTRGTHKVDVVPGTPIVYNSDGGEIFDLSDPENPVKVDTPLPRTCHRVSFFIEPSRQFYRAYCAAYTYTDIWDIADPIKPKLVVSIPMWHANPRLPPTSMNIASFSHTTMLSHDGKILVVGDETGGGLLPACTVHAPVGSRDMSAPIGALWFYDVSNEQDPVLRGWISARSHFLDNPQGGTKCTAHHGRLVPDPQGARHLLVAAFYGAGLLLIDFTDPSAPRVVDQYADAMNTWEAWYYNGFVFTGDLARGLEAFRFVS